MNDNRRLRVHLNLKQNAHHYFSEHLGSESYTSPLKISVNIKGIPETFNFPLLMAHRLNSIKNKFVSGLLLCKKMYNGIVVRIDIMLKKSSSF